MGVYLIECRICGKQYTGSKKTNFQSRENNYKGTRRRFMNKKEVPKKTHFHVHYCAESHNGIEDWVITLIHRADFPKDLRKRAALDVQTLNLCSTVATKRISMTRFEKKNYILHA